MDIVGKIDKLAKAMEVNFDEYRLSERWCRAREYFNQIEDEHWDDILRNVKATLGDTRIYPGAEKKPYGPPNSKI